MKPETQANSKQFWQDHVNQWNENSISQASYCQEHGLPIKRFGYYKRKLLGATTQTSAMTKGNGFIQLSSPTHYSARTSALIVELPNQLRIEGVTADNVQLVKQLAGLFQ
ncbi:IS66 family insertion sequence element accessory protein TnpA [sulfur-oxidizing endosymbiont of Gigantopelta aegis]|uniref:IS66 family insertion sequence element accessory protein TnpA n=1 Tax=sulfur-oxidizing endosymbiont of Gigantopelta aegis TaxID=2794934 RepID=UPI0018DDC329|nr:hypothetical protein [sulfur-oxidizing endosymbiont of Gigantopelta aegis]